MNVTVAGSALFEFFETKTRPPEVAAHIVSWSVPRETAVMLPPERVPKTVLVSVGPPSGNQSVPQTPVKRPSLVPNSPDGGVAVLLEERAVTAEVRRPPDVLAADEDRVPDDRVR